MLASNAYHHRVDSLTSFVALLTIGGSNVLTNAQWLDPVGGLVISMMVIQAGWGNTKTALLELADVGVEEEMKANVRRVASKAFEDIPVDSSTSGLEVRQVQGLKSGQNYLMEVEISVPGGWSLNRMQDAENVIREQIGAKVRGVKRVKIRFVANETPEQDFADEFIGPDVSPRSSLDPEYEEHAHTNGNGAEHHHHNVDAHYRSNGGTLKRK